MRKHLLFFLIIPILFQFILIGAETLNDRIEAVVENEVITSGELQTQLFTYYLQNRITDTTKTTRDSIANIILQQMINDKVIKVKAEEDTTITVDNSEVESEVEKNIEKIKENYPDDTTFFKALQQEGLTLSKLKQRYRTKAREQILARKFFQNKIGYIPEVTQSEIDSFYNANKDSIPDHLPGEYTLSHIYIVYKPGKHSLSLLENKVKSILKQYADGVSFSKLARKYSEDTLSSSHGGVLGKLTKSDMLPEIYSQISDMGEGEIRVVQSRLGYHIVLCTGRDGDKYVLSHILLVPKVTRADSLEMQRTAEKVYKLLQKGKPFKELVKKYSDDIMTKDKDGLIGTFEEAKMSPQLLQYLKGLKTGDFTRIINTPNGFEILYIDAYKPGKRLSKDEIRNSIRAILSQMKQQEALNKLVDRLKKDVYIRVYDQ